MTFSLEALYLATGTLKQNVHGYIERMLKRKSMEQQILSIVREVRANHPDLGVREMYFKIGPDNIGRDAFEQLCSEEGLMVRRYKNFHKTTDSTNTRYFDNLIEGIYPQRPNQIWQSDITFFEINMKFHYITLIQDAFTKIIVGHFASASLSTESTTLPALQKAIRFRKGQNLKGLIFHSDGGGQYYDNAFVTLTQDEQMINSMGKSCYENAMAESLNGVIKNKYLRYKKIKSLSDLKRELDHIVLLYNSDKPHSALHRVNPILFEKRWLSSCHQTKAKMKSQSTQNSNEGASSPFI